ncbi:MAG: GspE/PulE family protein [Deltaproteobacteria bacterium]|nr:GspE/PulE family protein [Deltaproteobacteria bacterium]
MTQPQARLRIGEILVQKGYLTEAQLQKVLERQKECGGKLGDTCVKMGVITDDQKTDGLALQLGIARVQLASYLIEPEVLSLVTPSMASRNKLVPLFRIEDTLTVAMADPLNIYAIDELRRQTGLEIDSTITTLKEIDEALRQHYGVGAGFQKEIAELGREQGVDLNESGRTEESRSQDAPIIKLVNTVLAQAVGESASDIHIEPMSKALRVRYRVDGILHEASSIPAGAHGAVVSRLKVMAGLDISERRIPQDGRFQVAAGGRNVDMRMSTYPSILGEKVVIRVLDKTKMGIALEGLGMDAEVLAALEGAILRPSGILLLTGPTGSGKTTTLYAALQRIASIEKNVMTIEDPVEYDLETVTQSQVNQKAGLTFATGLRSILRQDPDVIMVGEIRDRETAEIAVRAAMTGHLVLSTLHTNDAPSAVPRLVELGLERFVVASSLNAVLAQRLVRKVCGECAEPCRPSDETLARLGPGIELPLEDLRRGAGCTGCQGTGFRGRTGLFEMFEMTESMQDFVGRDVSAVSLRKEASENGMRLLRQDGIDKAVRGTTTIEEVLRVT